MIVSQVLATYTGEANYMVNSMILKSSNDTGCTYKWLFKHNSAMAKRREVFIATSTTEDTVESRTVVTSIEVVPGE